MSRWSIKHSTCTKCGDSFEWTTRCSDFCRPCRGVIKNQRQFDKRRELGVRPYNRTTKDTLPEQDWVMERQFSSFYALLGKRYRDIKDVVLT